MYKYCSKCKSGYEPYSTFWEYGDGMSHCIHCWTPYEIYDNKKDFNKIKRLKKLERINEL